MASGRRLRARHRPGHDPARRRHAPASRWRPVGPVRRVGAATPRALRAQRRRLAPGGAGRGGVAGRGDREPGRRRGVRARHNAPRLSPGAGRGAGVPAVSRGPRRAAAWSSGQVGAVLGAALDRVYVVGLAEGVLPGRLPPDPLASAEPGADPLQRRQRVREADRRGFLGALAAADEGRVLLSYPRSDGGARARYPSRWFLECAARAEGRSVYTSDLPRLFAEGRSWLVRVESPQDGLGRSPAPATSTTVGWPAWWPGSAPAGTWPRTPSRAERTFPSAPRCGPAARGARGPSRPTTATCGS